MAGRKEQRNPQRRRLIFWLGLATSTLAVLVGVLARQDRINLLRWSVFLSADPEQGRAVFQAKGCIHCHSVNGVGGKIGPDLGGLRGEPYGPAFLVTAMWNHAPHMWAFMQEDHFVYPSPSYEEAAQVIAYLYMAGRSDGAGDAQHGQLLFRKDGCALCHGNRDTGKRQPDLASVVRADAIQTPAAWVQAMWNSAPAMDEAMRKAALPWPKLNSSDLNDLYAYMREGLPDTAVAQQIAGDPERGWQVFQSKGCIRCHAMQNEGPSNPRNWQPNTFMQLGEFMWNDAPNMLQAMQTHGIATPKLTGQEMTDLSAFIYGLKYFDPPGSAVVGRSIFRWRGCSRCHGEEAQGTALAPALRGLGRNYNSISLATALWSHGRKMFQRNQELGLGWPTLQPGDVGDLLAFLNAPREDRH